jgi:hypothetical protein
MIREYDLLAEKINYFSISVSPVVKSQFNNYKTKDIRLLSIMFSE